MPNIEISKKDLEKLCGRVFTDAQLQDILQFTKMSIEKTDGDTITFKVEDTNRADLLSVEGLSRELKGIIGKEEGIKEYKIEKSNFIVNINQKVKKVRPFTVCAVVKNINFTDETIKQVIQLQEKLSETFGRKRKEAAIGVYDFDKIKWPITYTTYRPEELSFIPLGFAEKLNLKQILQRHEKGQLYGNLLKDAKEYPIFIDADENVLSMPPVINSEYSGKVTEETKNVFIEVSGFDQDKISHILNIIVSALAERNGQIYSVELKNKNKITTPDFKTRSKTMTLEEINYLLGLDLKPKQVQDLLKKLRYDVKAKENQFTVEIPFYRKDVIHNVDIIEDIAIAYGFKKFIPLENQIFTQGSVLEETNRRQKISDLLIGLEFQEIISFILSNKKEQINNMNLKSEPIIEITNPVSETFTCLRRSLLPSACKFLSNNTTKDFPQKIFEIGKVLEPSKIGENKTKESDILSINISHAKSNFTEIAQVLDYLMKNLKLEYKLVPIDYSSFIQGRSAEIILIKEKQEKSIGIIGEVCPQVIENWNLKMPLVSLELNFDALF